MQFNSYVFIFLFLPVFVLVYYLFCKVSTELGKAVIISASILFYSWGRWNMLLYLAASIVFNYALAFLIYKMNSQSRTLLAFAAAVNILFLLFFKYLNFSIENLDLLLGTHIGVKDIILPLGISFYTFQQIAYIVSVSKGMIEKPCLLDYLAYILYFPKLVMGPLAEPADLIAQFNDDSRKRANAAGLACGIKLFSLGLIKKVLFADTFSKAVSWIWGHPETATSADCLLLILFYTFEIYFDFSGYSDMAIGVSMMINIDLPMNFDSPYKALSIRDFWKRWHISLTKFLTKYIYIPLGGSRKGAARTYINTIAVFLISGLWHGANWTFVLWGLLHGALSCMDRALDSFEKKVPRPVRWLLTFAAVNVLWLLFSAPSISQWGGMLCKALSLQDMTVSGAVKGVFMLNEMTFIMDNLHLWRLYYLISGFEMWIMVITACVICFIPQNNYRNRTKLDWLSWVLTVLGLVWGVLCLGAESTFVYFGF